MRLTGLPGGGGKAWLKRGIVDLLDVDPGLVTSLIHLR
jgi:hypothetical protein